MTVSWKRDDPPETAGLGARVAAFVVDALLATGIFAVIAAAFLVWSGATSGLTTETDLLAVLLPTFLLYLPVLLVYFTAAEGGWRATPGKRLLHIEVRRMDGDAPSLFDSFIRNALRFLWFVPFIGLLFAVADIVLIYVGEVDQRIGDLGARTMVVRSA